ncbi:hypothetical protein M758_UG296200 [Ceratodon purpureus]|nr:hypothetical protein M758_UG296200 [Ceratodon purpureus]
MGGHTQWLCRQHSNFEPNSPDALLQGSCSSAEEDSSRRHFEVFPDYHRLIPSGTNEFPNAGQTLPPHSRAHTTHTRVPTDFVPQFGDGPASGPQSASHGLSPSVHHTFGNQPDHGQNNGLAPPSSPANWSPASIAVLLDSSAQGCRLWAEGGKTYVTLTTKNAMPLENSTALT